MTDETFPNKKKKKKGSKVVSPAQALMADFDNVIAVRLQTLDVLEHFDQHPAAFFPYVIFLGIKNINSFLF